MFLEQLTPEYPGDFARYVCALQPRKGADREAYWTTEYAPVAGVVERVCLKVERLGVQVLRAVRLSDLRPLFERYRVITVLAHWKFMALAPQDLLDTPKMMAELQAPRGLLQEQIAQAVKARHPELLTGTPSRGGAEALLAALNAVIADAHRGYRRSGNSGSASDDEMLQRLTRPALEEAFPTFVRAGKSVELADGMHTVSEFAQTVPPAFQGVLDLSVCNSVLLGAAVKRVAPGSLVANNRYPADIVQRITLYGLVVERLSRRREPYPDAMSFVHERAAGKQR
jgi:hypothetical protein